MEEIMWGWRRSCGDGGDHVGMDEIRCHLILKLTHL